MTYMAVQTGISFAMPMSIGTTVFPIGAIAAALLGPETKGKVPVAELQVAPTPALQRLNPTVELRPRSSTISFLLQSDRKFRRKALARGGGVLIRAQNLKLDLKHPGCLSLMFTQNGGHIEPALLCGVALARIEIARKWRGLPEFGPKLPVPPQRHHGCRGRSHGSQHGQYHRHPLPSRLRRGAELYNTRRAAANRQRLSALGAGRQQDGGKRDQQSPTRHETAISTRWTVTGVGVALPAAPADPLPAGPFNVG
jgi:hypothetical protein